MNRVEYFNIEKILVVLLTLVTRREEGTLILYKTGQRNSLREILISNPFGLCSFSLDCIALYYWN